MLRLKVSLLAPWVDSTGRRRSAHEGFSSLSEPAKALLDSGQLRDSIVWDMAIVSDEQPFSATAKWLETPQHDAVAYHSLDADTARRSESLSRQLWTVLARWLPGASEDIGFLAKDFLLGFGEEPADIRKAFGPTWLADLGLITYATHRPGLYAATTSLSTISLALGLWWPSMAGFFSVVRTAGPSSALADILTEGTVTQETLPELRWVVESSRTYENAGFRLLTIGLEPEQVLSEWRENGWVDGVPLLSVLGLNAHPEFPRLDTGASN
jgi:hypothetical protein